MGYVYLKTLKLIESGEPFMLFDNRWVLPGYYDATIIGDSLFKMQWIEETPHKLQTELQAIKYFTLSDKGREELENGKVWWYNKSFLSKLFHRLFF